MSEITLNWGFTVLGTAGVAGLMVRPMQEADRGLGGIQDEYYAGLPQARGLN